MAKIDGVDKVLRAMKQAKSKYFDSPNATKGRSVIVGYTAAYALYVHENLQAYHHVGQAKYLQQPARAMAVELARRLTRAVKRGAPMQQALYLAGLVLQRASQKLCPVLTGNLKNSAFTRKE